MNLILFWAAIGALIYVFAAFTALIIVRGRFFPKPFIQGDITPFASIIIAAYNEEENIAAKIENTLALDYPSDKLEILIGSDGSTDRTAEIVQQFTDPRIHFYDLPRSGKNGVLNTIVPKATGEILVFFRRQQHLHPLRHPCPRARLCRSPYRRRCWQPNLPAP